MRAVGGGTVSTMIRENMPFGIVAVCVSRVCTVVRSARAREGIAVVTYKSP